MKFSRSKQIDGIEKRCEAIAYHIVYNIEIVNLKSGFGEWQSSDERGYRDL